MSDMMHWMFSYGTLQQPEVQISNFGRLLHGEPDRLLGFALEMLQIKDPEVVRVSGKEFHPVLRRRADAEPISGTAFRINDIELAAADEYEVDDYARTSVTLESGRTAWVYIDVNEV